MVELTMSLIDLSISDFDSLWVKVNALREIVYAWKHVVYPSLLFCWNIPCIFCMDRLFGCAACVIVDRGGNISDCGPLATISS
jgi:hypothetical protein